jgi:hypothetical protein
MSKDMINAEDNLNNYCKAFDVPCTVQVLDIFGNGTPVYRIWIEDIYRSFRTYSDTHAALALLRHMKEAA